MAPRNIDLYQPLTEEFIRSLTLPQIKQVSAIYQTGGCLSSKKADWLDTLLTYYKYDYINDREFLEAWANEHKKYNARKERQMNDTIATRNAESAANAQAAMTHHIIEAADAI